MTPVAQATFSECICLLTADQETDVVFLFFNVFGITVPTWCKFSLQELVLDLENYIFLES